MSLLSLPALAAGTPPPAQAPFPDFGFMTSDPNYSGPVFRLSQDYPAAKPGPDKLPAFFSKLPATPFSNADFGPWHDYMMAVRAYCFEGNLEVDWRVQDNKVRTWYHIPWQHYGGAGREGIHGLTKEAPVQANQLAMGQGVPAPGDNYQTYAVGFYNEFGGYTIGRVWADHQHPDLNATTKPNGFPNGTVICKLLLVDVPSEQVPSLINPMQWLAYAQVTYGNPARVVKTMSLIQMDIAIKDDRAPLGWLFGTFQYNGKLGESVRWKNLIPVGIMWGNDPTMTANDYTNPTPAATRINPALRESAINPNTKELPPTHLGWDGRLNGPVDNPMSSCMSCHMTAQVPTVTALSPLFTSNPPPVGSPAWMRWFTNVACATPFDPDTLSADYCLQLTAGVNNFNEWALPNQSGLFAKDFKPKDPTDAAATAKPAVRRTHPVARDVVPGRN